MYSLARPRVHLGVGLRPLARPRAMSQCNEIQREIWDVVRTHYEHLQEKAPLGKDPTDRVVGLSKTTSGIEKAIKGQGEQGEIRGVLMNITSADPQRLSIQVDDLTLAKAENRQGIIFVGCIFRRAQSPSRVASAGTSPYRMPQRHGRQVSAIWHGPCSRGLLVCVCGSR